MLVLRPDDRLVARYWELAPAVGARESLPLPPLERFAGGWLERGGPLFRRETIEPMRDRAASADRLTRLA